MNLGDQYTLIYGQLENVAVAEGDVVERGQLFRIRGTADQILLQRRHKSIFCHGERRSKQKIRFYILNNIMMPGSKA